MLKTPNLSLLAIMATAILLIPLSISSFQQQQAYAPRDCPRCGEFKKMTHEFEKNIITAISEGNTDDENEDIDSFVLFMRSLFPPDDTLNALIANYEDGVKRILSAPPPDDGKPHDQIKDFRQLTHTFRTEVLEIAHQGLSEGPR